MDPMTQEDLAGMRCEVPGCTCGGTNLVLKAKCHPYGLEARYDSMAGVCSFSCLKCKAPVGVVLVAHRSAAPVTSH